MSVVKLVYPDLRTSMWCGPAVSWTASRSPGNEVFHRSPSISPSASDGCTRNSNVPNPAATTMALLAAGASAYVGIGAPPTGGRGINALPGGGGGTGGATGGTSLVSPDASCCIVYRTR